MNWRREAGQLKRVSHFGDDRGAVTDQRIRSRALRSVDRTRYCSDGTTKLECVASGYHRATLYSGFDHDRDRGQRGDESITPRKGAWAGVRTGELLRQQQSV